MAAEPIGQVEPPPPPLAPVQVLVPPALFTTEEFRAASLHINDITQILGEHLGSNTTFTSPNGQAFSYNLIDFVMNQLTDYRQRLDRGQPEPTLPDESALARRIKDVFAVERSVLHSMVGAFRSMIGRTLAKLREVLAVIQASPVLPIAPDVQYLVRGPVSIVPRLMISTRDSVTDRFPHSDEMDTLKQDQNQPAWFGKYLSALFVIQNFILLLKLMVVLAEQMVNGLPLAYITAIQPPFPTGPNFGRATATLMAYSQKSQAELAALAMGVINRANQLTTDSLNTPNHNHAEYFLPPVMLDAWIQVRRAAMRACGLSGELYLSPIVTDDAPPARVAAAVMGVENVAVQPGRFQNVLAGLEAPREQLVQRPVRSTRELLVQRRPATTLPIVQPPALDVTGPRTMQELLALEEARLLLLRQPQPQRPMARNLRELVGELQANRRLRQQEEVAYEELVGLRRHQRRRSSASSSGSSTGSRSSSHGSALRALTGLRYASPMEAAMGEEEAVPLQRLERVRSIHGYREPSTRAQSAKRRREATRRAREYYTGSSSSSEDNGYRRRRSSDSDYEPPPARRSRSAVPRHAARRRPAPRRPSTSHQ